MLVLTCYSVSKKYIKIMYKIIRLPTFRAFAVKAKNVVPGDK